MAITQLPEPPSRSDPSTFAAKGDAFLAALQQFVNEANTLLAQCEQNATVALTFGDVKDQLENYHSEKKTDGLGFITTKGKLLGSPGGAMLLMPNDDNYPVETTNAAGVTLLKHKPASNAETIEGIITSQPVTPAGNKAALDARLANASVLHLGTVQTTTSGTAKEFTGIPPWVKRIQLIFNEVSTSGSDNLLVQLGDAGGYETSGYAATTGFLRNGYDQNGSSSTAGFVIYTYQSADTKSLIMTLVNISGNTWVCSFQGKSSSTLTIWGGGSKMLSDVLTRLKITTTSGTQTFDAGEVNIYYE